MPSRDAPDDTLEDSRMLETVPRPIREDMTNVKTIAPSAKYMMGPVLGAGGMGEVVLAHDREIGRDIAIKRLKTAEPEAEEVRRFLREARIQALLDHPAIVPVHEVGQDEDGHPYFTMKRLAGTTLADLLVKDTPQQRLLRAFTEVALAVERAHSLGVVHRDLKPANIMLGDFGEVYVLDWGLARVASGPERRREQTAEIDTLGDDTMAGAMLGTPGYMSPEQIQDARAVGHPTDTYALGSILFEILAGEPLHPRGQAAIASTLADIDKSPALRRPDRAIPPELDVLCREALAFAPAARPSARALADRVQSYLDGDRDHARRREMAAEYLATARAELARDDRAHAMRSAGRALALDPASAAAADIVTMLMLEPPKDPPPSLRAELAASDAWDVQRHANFSMLAYFAVLVLVPIGALNGIRNWTLIGASTGLAMALSALAFMMHRRPQTTWLQWVYAISNAAFLALLGGVFGPLLLVPALTCVVAMGLVSYPHLSKRSVLIIALSTLGWIAPAVLELVGVLPPSWSIVDGLLILRSHAFEVAGPFTVWFFFITSMMTIWLAAVLTSWLTKAHYGAKYKLITQAWQLKQLLPTS